MVFGNMGDDSGTGVAFTRNPTTGEHELYGEYLMNAQGEDVVAGIRTPPKIAQMETELPEVYEQFRGSAQKLEKHYRDMQDLEFTIERGKLYMLQTRVGKRTAARRREDRGRHGRGGPDHEGGGGPADRARRRSSSSSAPSSTRRRARRDPASPRA